jgi:hypothetical protein
MRKNVHWWINCVIHNMVVHPWLPLADALQSIGCARVPNAIYWLHDNTVPDGGG